MLVAQPQARGGRQRPAQSCKHAAAISKPACGAGPFSPMQAPSSMTQPGARCSWATPTGCARLRTLQRRWRSSSNRRTRNARSVAIPEWAQVPAYMCLGASEPRWVIIWAGGGGEGDAAAGEGAPPDLGDQGLSASSVVLVDLGLLQHAALPGGKPGRQPQLTSDRHKKKLPGNPVSDQFCWRACLGKSFSPALCALYRSSLACSHQRPLPGRLHVFGAAYVCLYAPSQH